MRNKARIPVRTRFLNLLGEARGLVRPELYFDEAEILRVARREAKLDDFGELFEPEIFRLLLKSAREDADFSFFGRRAFHAGLAATLAKRLRFIEAKKRIPEVFSRPLRPPLLIMGMSRTGTTLLQNLLGLHEGYRSIPVWEMRQPIPPWALGRRGEDERRAGVGRGMEKHSKYINPSNHIHLLGLDEPDECLHLTALTLKSSLFWLMGPLYRYVDALLKDDGRTKYFEYLDMLKLLQASAPTQSLLLKAPEHTYFLDRIMETIPGVGVIQTHRDPVKSSVSLMSLFHSHYSNVVKRLDVPRMSETVLTVWDAALMRNLRARQTHSGAVHDVFYRDLVSDPVAVVRGIYERFSITWPAGHEECLKSYLAKNPRGKHGGHKYYAAEFGVSEGEIRERLSGYIEHFGLGETS